MFVNWNTKKNSIIIRSLNNEPAKGSILVIDN